jgi:hypothetical protein
MSIIQALVFAGPTPPSIVDINAKAAEWAFVATDADLVTHAGFLPVRVGELETGFEYYFRNTSDDDLPEEAQKFGTHQMIARTGSRMDEMLASMMFFRAAAKINNAAYVYVDDGVVVAPTEVDSYLGEQISAIRSYMER